jgi:hypothetical protein
MEPALPDIFLLLPSFIMPPSVQFGFGDEALRRKVWLGVVFMQKHFGISKLFQTQKSFWHRFKANSFWRNSSDSYWEVFRSDENFVVLLLANNVKWRLVDQKWFKFQFEGYREPIFKAFILFAWIMIWFEKTLPTDPDCLPLIRKGLIRHVM